MVYCTTSHITSSVDLQSHSGFQWPWSTLVAFKDYSSRANWYRNPAEINLEIRKRLLPTKSGASSLRNYDGATHLSYQMPSKPFETTYCRAVDTPDECNKYRGFLPISTNVPATSLKVKKISRKKSSELGVYARYEISKNTAIAMDQQVNGLSTLPTTWSVIKSLENKGTDINQVINFMEGRGFCNMFMVRMMEQIIAKYCV